MQEQVRDGSWASPAEEGMYPAASLRRGARGVKCGRGTTPRRRAAPVAHVSGPRGSRPDNKSRLRIEIRRAKADNAAIVGATLCAILSEREAPWLVHPRLTKAARSRVTLR